MDLKIPHDAFVFVGDGRKALFLRNDGDEKFPYLKTERVFVDENPPSHEQGTERPGRISKGSLTGGRSAVQLVADANVLLSAVIGGRAALVLRHEQSCLCVSGC